MEVDRLIRSGSEPRSSRLKQHQKLAPEAAAVLSQPSLLAVVQRAAAYAGAARATNTKLAYEADWRAFEAWCASVGACALPALPGTVATYLADAAGRLAVATLARRLAALVTIHRCAGHSLDTRHPAIRETFAGIRRQHGAPPRRVAAATTVLIRRMVGTCDAESLIGLRDRALLLLGFAAALRRSELVALDVGDAEFVEEGIRLLVRRSKTDQTGEGFPIGVVRSRGSDTCPTQALEDWLQASRIEDGRLFRSLDRHGRIGSDLSDRAVALIVKQRASLAGLNPAAFSGHSLRSGLATSAAAAGVEEGTIQRQTRHRSLQTLRGYIREGSLFTRNASGRVGL